MKNKSNLAILCACIFASALFGFKANANQISGSIGFGSSNIDIVGSDFADATSFTVVSPFISSTAGDYNSVPLNTAVTFNGFVFNPPVASVSPLWSFTVGAVNYSFNATSVSSHFNANTDQWDIGGQGVATISGYGDTAGTWNIDLSESGATIVFDSSAGVTPAVPDGGTGAMLLGSGLVGLAALGRKRRI